VAALRIPVYELAGYEADDVIGTITRDLDTRGVDTTVVTGDLDMLQIVTEHTRLMTTRQGVDSTSTTTRPGSGSGSSCGRTR